MKKLVILGSTGSIGTQTLEVARAHPDDFQIIGLSAHGNSELFERQVREFSPRHALQTSVSENPQEALMALASLPQADIIVNAISGYAGLMPTYAAVKAGKTLALANKESLVMAGELIMDLAARMGAVILPIDSEPTAIRQMLDAEELRSGREAIEKVILTASGGPFWKWTRAELDHVTAAQALKHPTWKMGEKVSIDSATLMNKAFEIIEARWLFDLPPEKIEVTIHRQSIVHALLQFTDGHALSVLSQPDMRIAISGALFWPQRKATRYPRLDFFQLSLMFEKPDFSLFEGPRLAYEVLKSGGILPAVFAMADEIAVKKFLDGEIPFLGIYDFIKRALERVRNTPLSIEALTELPSQLI